MVNFLDIADYRDFLKAYYERRKKEMPLFSYRMMGEKLGLDASYLFRVLQKKQHLPSHAIPMAKELLGLSGRAAEYFDILVASAQTKDAKKKAELAEQAVALRDVERKSISESELRFLSEWWIAVVRAYIEISGGVVNEHEIANALRPKITEAQVKDAVELLKDLGLVTRLTSGKLKLSNAHLTVSGPDKAKAVRQFQRQVLSLASDSLENVPVEERDVSTLTVAVDAECFEDLREIIKEFRRLVQKRVDESSHPDRVMQLSMAFYPVTKVSGGS